ncbi:hypothetical protein XNA1_3780002 [Xenorhabdus nematophila str. Anatoliense]|nr:hypothetical protein XNA1_280002 [Xenorhabdus nematophila str. Anatoliense]CEE93430.1 hypothetical protein XNA1_3780002 [Xenorhabdus nematophila str. Anatoliense]
MRFDNISIIGNGVSGIATFISLVMYSNIKIITFISPTEMGGQKHSLMLVRK